MESFGEMNGLAKGGLAKAIALLAVYGTALAFTLLAYWDYRDSNISRAVVSKLSDLAQEFEIGDTSLTVKNPEFFKVCLAGDYVYALKDARQWFAGGESEFISALQAAGGRADTFNGEEISSIVLLSRKSAAILQLDGRMGFSVTNFGCANVDAGDVQMKRYLTNSATEFFLPNATLKASHPGQPPASLCAVHLQRFVDSIDDLMTENAVPGERYWAVVRKFLPSKGCTIEETVSIARTSRFFLPREGQVASVSRKIAFTNSDALVHFVFNKDTRTIEYPFVGLWREPTPSF